MPRQVAAVLLFFMVLMLYASVANLQIRKLDDLQVQMDGIKSTLDRIEKMKP